MRPHPAEGTPQFEQAYPDGIHPPRRRSDRTKAISGAAALATETSDRRRELAIGERFGGQPNKWGLMPVGWEPRSPWRS